MSYTNETEPKERKAYREKCKLLSEYEDICYLRSHHGAEWWYNNGVRGIGQLPANETIRQTA